MKHLVLLLAITTMAGCANHATFESPEAYTTLDEQFTGQTVHYSIQYSQPRPGIFSGGEQQKASPLSEAELSIVSRKSLANVEEIVERHLPPGMSPIRGQTDTDYQLDISITAYSKHGPTAWDFQFAKSLGVGLISLGLGPDYWKIIADFDVTYALENRQTGEVIEESYSVDEIADHQAGPFESTDPLMRASQDMFERHFSLTLNQFFERIDTLTISKAE
jgi:hypothetical protein